MDSSHRWIIAAAVALICATGILSFYSYLVSAHIERDATATGTTSKRPAPREKMSDPQPNTPGRNESSVPASGPSAR